MIRPVRPDGRIETGGAFKPIPRPRVVERIADAATQRVTLIVAPAGYGKSVALSQYLLGLESAWLRFDLRPEHDTLPGVLRGFAEAVIEAAPEARATMAGAYEKNRTSASAGAQLALWMQQHLKGWRGTIAVDDLHVAEADPEVVRFFSALIDRTKSHISWIISTRSYSGLPVGTWLAYGDCDLMVDQRDLRFTADEVKRAAKAFKLGVGEDELRELLELTDGWPTALSFALRTSTRSVELHKLTVMTREMVYQYLAEQVYRSLTDDERAFLHAVSLLSEIDVESMLTMGFDRARGIISELRERVAFLYEVRPEVYRCHDLFRDFVLHQLSLEGETATNALRCRIAGVMESLGRAPVALRLYADAREEESILRLLEAHGADLVATGHVDLVVSSIQVLTEEHRRERPIMLALRGTLEASGGNFTEAEPLLRRSLERSEDPVLRASVAMRLALLYINQGKDAANVLDAVLNETESLPEALLAEARSLRAVVAARAGQKELARQLLDRVEADILMFEESDSLARTLQRVGAAALELGLDQQARFAFARSAEASQRLSLHSLAALALEGLAFEAFTYENDLSVAVWHAQRAITAAGKSGDIFSMQNAALRLLSLELWRGDADRIGAIERRAGEFQTSDASRGLYIVESHAYRHLWEGKFSQAVSDFAAVLDRLPMGFDRIMERALYALSLSLAGRHGESKEEVAQVMEAIDADQPQRDGFASLHFEVAQLLAILGEIVSRRKTVAASLLKRRPVFSSRIGAESMRGAVKLLYRSIEERHYKAVSIDQDIGIMERDNLGGFARILAVAHEALQKPVQAEGENRELSAAELAVLRMLLRGMSPKQIAAETERSVLTVTTHIKNAMKKLECRGMEDLMAYLRRSSIAG